MTKIQVFERFACHFTYKYALELYAILNIALNTEIAEMIDIEMTFIRKQLCCSLYFNKVAGFSKPQLYQKETLTQFFSFKFCEI